jgi:hypothetical protein
MTPFDTSTPKEHAKIMVLLFVLALSVVGNLLSVWWYGGKTVHYIPVTATGEAGAKRISHPGQFPVVIQTHTAELVVKTLGNVTPNSLLPAIQTVRPYLEPSTYTALHVQGAAESATMRVADLSIMTTDVVLKEMQSMKHHGRSFLRMQFTAIRHLFSYGMALERHPVTIVVDVMPPPVGSGLQESLRVTHIAWPELKIKDGAFQNFSFTEEIVGQIQPFRRGVTRP